MGNQYSDGYNVDSYDLGVVFHYGPADYTHIFIQTKGNKTMVKYCLGHGEYAIAYLKQVDGALIMNVFPNNEDDQDSLYLYLNELLFQHGEHFLKQAKLHMLYS